MFECPGIKLSTKPTWGLPHCLNCGRQCAYRMGRPVHTGRRVAPRRWIKIARATA